MRLSNSKDGRPEALLAPPSNPMDPAFPQFSKHSEKRVTPFAELRRCDYSPPAAARARSLPQPPRADNARGPGSAAPRPRDRGPGPKAGCGGSELATPPAAGAGRERQVQ
ncbi:hypothetical protein ACRRTK_017306 [Alexandromys fortis]